MDCQISSWSLNHPSCVPTVENHAQQDHGASSHRGNLTGVTYARLGGRSEDMSRISGMNVLLSLSKHWRGTSTILCPSFPLFAPRRKANLSLRACANNTNSSRLGAIPETTPISPRLSQGLGGEVSQIPLRHTSGLWRISRGLVRLWHAKAPLLLSSPERLAIEC